ncbi:F-box/LRR-repeat protein [Morus notabilis]|uniref:F-box/LRR-repeat protein n=2 Tax=Morus notabilis TaxID=981085 RepID=W9R3D3_9ROSA|nr:F-box/LRR-repeat protein [Morus notabilis]
MNKKVSRSTSWSDLPHDILVRIFMSLNLLDLVTGAFRTCRTWRAACSDPSLWKKLDLNSVQLNMLSIARRPFSMADNRSCRMLLLVLCGALNLSRGNLTCLMLINFYVDVDGRELIYAAQR